MADRRYIDGEGQEWASRYESELYEHLRGVGIPVRRCERGSSDTFNYTSKVQGGVCLECSSGSVVQQRTYTPDLRIDASYPGPLGGAFIEAKGYWRAPKRNLLRSVLKANPDLPLLLVFQRDLWVTKGKSKYSDYVARYLKSAIGSVVWRKGMDFQFLGG